MSGDPDPGLAGTNKSIAIGLLLIVFGVCLAMLPFAQVTYFDHDNAGTYTFAPVPYWFGMLFALSGLSILLARVIKIEATGAGNMKLFGFELPIEVGGPIFVTFFLLLGGAAVSLGTGLHNFKDNRASISEAIKIDELEFVTNHPTYMKLNEDFGDLESNLRQAQDELARAQGERRAYETMLLSAMKTGAEIMRVRIDCGDKRGTHWISWPKRRENEWKVRAITTSRDTKDADPQEFEPFRIYEGQMSYHLYPPINTGSELSDRAISFRLSVGSDKILTGTFEASGRSLEEFCEIKSRGERFAESDPTLDESLPDDLGTDVSEATAATAVAASGN